MLIFLIGFMCCGKTTDGKAAAEMMKIPFLDLDCELEKRSGKSIWNFIEDNGIAEFRRLENEILLDTPNLLQSKILETHHQSQRPEAVIATGGGSILSKENRDFLANPQNCVIWLDLPFPLLLERIRLSQRPLLRGLSDEEVLAVYQERLPFYQNICTHRITAVPFPDIILELFLIPTR